MAGDLMQVFFTCWLPPMYLWLPLDISGGGIGGKRRKSLLFEYMHPIVINSLKILKWIFYIALILVIVLLLFIEFYYRHLSSEKGAFWLYDETPKEVTLHYTNNGIRYLSIGDADKPPLLLIHGAPGGLFDWSMMSKREDLYGKYRLLIPERPGYGGTKPRKAEPSIKMQAERLLEVLEGESQKAVVMGHSYGAPIAVVMGALQPDKIEKVIGVSGQYDPDNEITFKISYLFQANFFKYLMPRVLWVSNVEKLKHPAAQREIIPLYSQVQVPVLLIHGDADSLVPYENSPYLMKFLGEKGELITLPGYDHPLQMQTPDYLVDVVLGKVAGALK